jgi:hypothetical protein
MSQHSGVSACKPSLLSRQARRQQFQSSLRTCKCVKFHAHLASRLSEVQRAPAVPRSDVLVSS